MRMDEKPDLDTVDGRVRAVESLVAKVEEAADIADLKAAILVLANIVRRELRAYSG